MLALLLSLLLSVAGAAEPQILRFSRAFTNVYVVVGAEGAILVDAHYPDSEDWILKRLDRAGLTPADISLVVLTHGHPDHAGASAALQREQGMKIAVGSGDAAMLTQGDSGEPTPTDWRGRLILLSLKPNYPSLSPDVVVTDRLDLRPYGVAGEARVMGGHSDGSLVITLEDGRVLSGDLIRGHFIRRRFPTLHFFHMDIAQAHANLGTLLDEGATDFLVAHGKPIPAQRVRRWLERHTE